MPCPVTLILPYYRQPRMLEYQLAVLNQYGDGIQVIIVDDGSPEPAYPVIVDCARSELLANLRLYRITEDKPWNREMARNLGALKAETDWIMQLDLDHVLPAECLPALLVFTPKPQRWYRFPRWRRGTADETRQKDQIAPDCPYGQIHPHIDSYLVEKFVYWSAGGYNEDFSGVLGGGSEFLQRLEHEAHLDMLPERIHLEVITRSVVQDASDLYCSRDTRPGKELWRSMTRHGGRTPKPTSWLRLPWQQIL